MKNAVHKYPAEEKTLSKENKISLFQNRHKNNKMSGIAKRNNGTKNRLGKNININEVRDGTRNTVEAFLAAQ